ncbi:hypothetical protein [Nocardia sp. NPDC057668]|uniref:hypothetical protein n=1 Tax=Nocardia sp. NPDC057668 TaxID=3346202 RepID=UPI0036710B6C
MKKASHTMYLGAGSVNAAGRRAFPAGGPATLRAEFAVSDAGRWRMRFPHVCWMME